VRPVAAHGFVGIATSVFGVAAFHGTWKNRRARRRALRYTFNRKNRRAKRRALRYTFNRKNRRAKRRALRYTFNRKNRRARRRALRYTFNRKNRRAKRRALHYIGNRQPKIGNYCSFRQMSSPADPRASSPRVAGRSVATAAGALYISGTRVAATGPVSPARIGLFGSVS